MAFNDEINTIINALIAVSDKFFNYDEAKKKALEDYRGNALEQRLNAVALDLKGATKNYVISMDRATRRMIDEAKAGNAYDINDASVGQAAALLANKGIAVDAAAEVIKSFAGNITALELIKGAAHEDYKPLFDRWIFDNVGSLERIQATINSLPDATPENYPSTVSAIRKKLVEFAAHQGIDLDTPHMAEQLREMRERNIARLAGVEWDVVKSAK